MTIKNRISLEKLHERKYPREEDIRGHFFRDVTAVIHSYPYRRLKHKTQVFFAPQNDHICTRMEHVMHVATISVTICKALGLDTDLAWGISMGHDLGHTPFGHTGENIISEIMKASGGFCHEIYSLRMVDYLINNGKGLNLTYGVRDGIVNHCGEQFEQYLEPSDVPAELEKIKKRNFLPCTWEGIIVRTSDKIAYLGRDMEDALRLGIITREQIPKRVTDILGIRNSDMINTLVYDVVNTCEKVGKIGFSDKIYEAMTALKRFNYENIYQSEALIKYHQYIERIIRTLWDYLEESFDKNGFDIEKYMDDNIAFVSEFGGYLKKMKDFYLNTEKHSRNVILDYIAGMTDTYAIDSVSELFFPGEFSYRKQI